MNLVKMITDQLSGDAIGTLSSRLGADEDATRRATAAAVPSMLSVLANLSSSTDGAKKLSDVLGSLDLNSLSNMAQMFGGHENSALNQGNSLLGSLFSNSLLSGLSNAVSRFSGLSAGAVKSLLAFLSPLVLGKVASLWKDAGGGPQALKSVFGEQRDNIANAMPSGLSLADIVGGTTSADPAPRAYVGERRKAREPVGASSSFNWLLPAAMALLGGFLLWQLMRPRADEVASAPPAQPRSSSQEVVAMKPALPEATDEATLAKRATDELGGLFTSLDAALAGVNDAASAERALPELRKINAKVDDLTQITSLLPASAMDALRAAMEPQAKAVVERAYAVGEIAGVDPSIKEILQQIIVKIVRWFPSQQR